jgi:ribosome-associated protein
VEIFWNVRGSRALSEDQRARLLDRLASRLTTEGSIRIVASDLRSQSRNRDLAEEKLVDIVRRALVIPKKRRPTRPTKASKEARLEGKKRRSRTKRERQNKSFD